MAEKRFFWLKLKRDFFKRHDIMIIEAMPNGKDYILFYLKLLAESIDHEGHLRFSQTIPYNEQMLSTITNTNIDIVRCACKVFLELDLMEKLDDGTLFMNESKKMIGSESSSAERVRKYRENNTLLHCNDDVTKSNDYIELEKEKEKETQTVDLDNFNILWNMYPRKEGKKESIRHYKASLKKHAHQDIELALNNYLQKLKDEKTEPKYIKQGSTFFNNWEDYLTAHVVQTESGSGIYYDN